RDVLSVISWNGWRCPWIGVFKFEWGCLKWEELEQQVVRVVR
ncbi:hypothetical protein A2U01_0083294, partial [Trifolium medium]|nr:hypothetical protein [Trifolium medium]